MNRYAHYCFFNARLEFDRRHWTHDRAADTAGLSVRALAYKLPAARQALAAALDSLDLL